MCTILLPKCNEVDLKRQTETSEFLIKRRFKLFSFNISLLDISDREMLET